MTESTTDPLAQGGTHALGGLARALEARRMLRSLLPGGGTPPAMVPVTSVELDSRRVRPGSLFVAVPGQHADGHDFASRAVSAGAVAVVAERALPGLGVPQLLVPSARPALAVAAAWIHDQPSHRLGVVGITGTDGKTTTAFLVRSMLQAAGHQTGLIGTIDVIVGGRSRGNPTRATTPEAPELQAHLAAMLAAGDLFVVLESTSHGLAQERVGEVAYDVAVMTNVTHEHLEFHGTHEAYRTAKRRLFERLQISAENPAKGWRKTGIVNRDDPWADEFAAAGRGAGARVLAYGTDPAADVVATGVEEGPGGLRLAVRTARWSGQLRVALAGRFNVHNALAAVAVGEALELDPGAIRDGIEALRAVPGRMQRIDAGQPFTVVVDYAHTPESLGKALDNLAPLAAARGGRLVAVFGSAGDRDRQKRSMMGRVAAERCKLVVLTDEDPRTEDRAAILEEIASGAEALGRRRDQELLLIADRGEAIRAALEQAGPGDVVLLAGKGHERTIETATGAIPWDEAAAAREALAELGYRSR